MPSPIRVILAGWAIFFAVFSVAGLVIPDRIGGIPLLLALLATVLCTPAAYAYFATRELDT